MRSKSRSKMEQEEQDKEYRQSQNDLLNQRTTTHHSTITNMRKAYQEVVDSGHTPTPEEIHFRRYTSGSMVDSK